MELNLDITNLICSFAALIIGAALMYLTMLSANSKKTATLKRALDKISDLQKQNGTVYLKGVADGKEMYENELLAKQAEELNKGFN